MEQEIRVIRSKRKTLALQILPDGQVVVRAPLRVSQREIRAFTAAHEDWIARHRAQVLARAERRPPVEKLTAEELRALAEQAKRVVPERVAYYAPRVGVRYGRITIRSQHTRWGSCSAQGNLNFNCLLMLSPPEALDSVVVHELCHRLVPNHSPQFYAEVLRVYPEYRKWDAWLKTNGPQLIRRLPE